MPELPEVEAVCRKLRPHVRGRNIVAMRVLRAGIVAPQTPAFVEESAAGRTIREVRRRGKNILLMLNEGSALHVHLRMTGNLRMTADAELRPAVCRAYLELDSGKAILYDDPRAIGRIRFLAAPEVDALLASIGPEPLSRAFTPQSFIDAAHGSRQPAKLFLMDQRHIAGLGNIYAAEALFEARVNPQKPIGKLSTGKLGALHAAIVAVLSDAVKSACTGYSNPRHLGEAEWYPVAVYGREGEPCCKCGRGIRRFSQGDRSTYYCPGCQK
jgi:formamidopyrimidine-DNA glycosylase